MRLLILSMICAAVVVPVAGATTPEYQGGAGRVTPQRFNAGKKKKKKASRKYINLAALHESLPGSHLHDEGCLLLRADDCDVVFLADDEQRLKCIFVRVAPHVKKAKRRAVLNAVKSRLRMVYNKPAQPDEMLAAAGNAALLYYDPIEEDSGRGMLSESRWDALRYLYGTFAESDPALQDAAGLACAFTVEKDGVELEIAVDLASPVVNYVELRGGKVQNKMKTNPEEVVESVFPSMGSKPERAYAMFGKGACRLRTLIGDGTYYLTRNARFFAAGTVDALKTAVENEANFKKYGFASPDFAAWQATLPTIPVADTLLTSPEEPEEAEEDKPEEAPEHTPTEAPVVTPSAEQGGPPQPEQPQTTPQPTEPLTPEAARDAYRKMLREM